MTITMPRPKTNKLATKPSTASDTKPRYKLLTGNGTHTAVGEFIGVLHGSSDKYLITFTDGFTVEAKFFGYHNNSKYKLKCMGKHYFRGYPCVKDSKLIAVTITSVDSPSIITNLNKAKRDELWFFRGLWTPQKNLSVQRSFTAEGVKKQAKETGFIKKYKFTFANSSEWRTKLWFSYVYEVCCSRAQDSFMIRRVTPFCCPRRKPLKK